MKNLVKNIDDMYIYAYIQIRIRQGSNRENVKIRTSDWEVLLELSVVYE